MTDYAVMSGLSDNHLYPHVSPSRCHHVSLLPPGGHRVLITSSKPTPLDANTNPSHAKMVA